MARGAWAGPMCAAGWVGQCGARAEGHVRGRERHEGRERRAEGAAKGHEGGWEGARGRRLRARGGTSEADAGMRGSSFWPGVGGGYNQPSCSVCKLCKVLERESPRGVPRDFFFSARPRKKKKILGGPRDFQPQESPQTLQGSPTPTHAPTHPPSACGCSLVPHSPHRTPAATASGPEGRSGAAREPSGRGGALWALGPNRPIRATRPPSALGGAARAPRARERRSADAWAPGRGRPGGANLGV